MEGTNSTFTRIYEGKLSHGFQRICKKVSLVGSFIYDRGGFPVLDIGCTKTGGNISLRHSDGGAFIITSAGSHKGDLQEDNFVLVLEIDFQEKKIWYQASRKERHPSTDAIFHGSVFKNFPLVGAIIHTHQDVPNKNAILQLDYPPIDSNQWDMKLRDYFLSDIQTVTLKNHIENKRDAALFFGKTLSDTFDEYCRQMNVHKTEKKVFKGLVCLKNETEKGR